MGVLPCYREGCRNIMCNLCSSTYGYLCEECYEELLNTPIGIEIFMKTDKESFTKQKHREYVENEFYRIWDNDE